MILCLPWLVSVSYWAAHISYPPCWTEKLETKILKFVLAKSFWDFGLFGGKGMKVALAVQYPWQNNSNHSGAAVPAKDRIWSQ